MKSNSVENFYTKINKDSNGCWNWTGHTSSNGYGKFSISGKRISAHRFSYIINKGDPEEGLLIRHTCDNRKCVNPEHLILGTIKDNMQDKVDRDRCAKGENHGRSKLTELDVIYIFTNTEKSFKDLSKIFNVHPSVVSEIKKRLIWKHITNKL